ncbi:MAG TPA: hypothetical protein VF671_11535 [Pseudomonas sp.]|jgi:hypothetical protein|uniref:hypothetical protein n=1 Tax=Pseudomonas sp. TaxID=306 RepID=UPI002ED7A96D
MSVANSWPPADTLDQAAGLRRWAEQNRADQAVAFAPARPTTAPERILMLFGTCYVAGQAYATLKRWHHLGHKWIGHPDRWRVVPVGISVKDFQPLVRQQPRWGIWINSEPDALRRSLQSLRQLRERGGPHNLLVLYADPPRPDLLHSFREAAQRHLGIRLLLIDEQRGPP